MPNKARQIGAKMLSGALKNRMGYIKWISRNAFLIVL